MNVLAIDLGSSGGRVMLVGHDLKMTELIRVPNEPVLIDGSYRWNAEKLFDRIISAIDKAIDTYDIDSIGICSWGVDYGIIDKNGNLKDMPFSYRDSRTEKIFACADKRKCYERSGIYPMAINTIFQLEHDKLNSRTEKGDKILLMADLFAYRLTGEMRAEITNTSTTGLLSIDGSNWNYDYIDELGLDEKLFPDLISPCEIYGTYHGIKVIAVCSHDTASAVYSMGEMDSGTAFIASGSWILFGKLIDEPIINGEAYSSGYTNERGFGNKVTFLNNANGLYVIQRLVKETGISYREIDECVNAAQSLGILDLNNLNDPYMADRIRNILGRGDAGAFDLFKTVYDSIAASINKNIAGLEDITGNKIKKILISGGMTKAPYLMDKLKKSSVEYITVETEGAVMGNAKIQLKALDH